MVSINFHRGYFVTLIDNLSDFEVKLSTSDIYRIICEKTEKVELTPSLIFFQRPSGNVTFMFYTVRTDGRRVPTSARLDMDETSWNNFVSKLATLRRPKVIDGKCTQCNDDCSNFDVHFNCSEYVARLQMFLHTPLGKRVLETLSLLVAHLFEKPGIIHCGNLLLDLRILFLVHVNIDYFRQALLDFFIPAKLNEHLCSDPEEFLFFKETLISHVVYRAKKLVSRE